MYDIFIPILRIKAPFYTLYKKENTEISYQKVKTDGHSLYKKSKQIPHPAAENPPEQAINRKAEKKDLPNRLETFDLYAATDQKSSLPSLYVLKVRRGNNS